MKFIVVIVGALALLFITNAQESTTTESTTTIEPSDSESITESGATIEPTESVSATTVAPEENSSPAPPSNPPTGRARRPGTPGGFGGRSGGPGGRPIGPGERPEGIGRLDGPMVDQKDIEDFMDMVYLEGSA